MGVVSQKFSTLWKFKYYTSKYETNNTPDLTYNYPARNLYGINRRFKVDWVKTHPWVHYSVLEDGVYCKACSLFAPGDVGRQKLEVFVIKPFQMWTKQSAAFTSHETHQYHQDAMAKIEILVLLQLRVLLACLREEQNSSEYRGT